MKKLFLVFVASASLLFICVFISNPVSGQSAGKSGGMMCKMIPENVMKIADKSCVNCHADPGNKVAQSHINLSKWDKYSPKKQAAKAQAMCNMVTKEKMPPKNFRESHPGDVPSKEDLKVLCDWAQSLQVDKK
jgi:hypothetical protein